MKVLVTCGPTWVAIDEVRVLSNRSTGEMGQLIASEFNQAGAQVTLIEGPVTGSLKVKGIKVLKYSFFEDLDKALKNALLQKFDIVVHAAAVSDFRPAKPRKAKISSGKAIWLKLVPTKKLINSIKLLSPNTFLVGFKLESDLTAARAVSLAKSMVVESHCDLVVANSVSKGYQGYLIDGDGQILAQASSKKVLARHLVRILK